MQECVFARNIARLATAVILGGFVLASRADPFQYNWQEVESGVWTGIREDSPRIPVMGTTTFIVGEKSVVVFDGGGLPLMSERAIEKIRSLTDAPVSHVAVSHWHQDHNFGIRAFVDAYPDVQIISHPYTREALIQANTDEKGEFKKSFHESVPGTVASIEEMLLADEHTDGTPFTASDRARYRQFVKDAEIVDREYRRIDPAYPTLTFEDRFVIHQAGREIHFVHLGRGNTGGDIVMWLPKEKVVATGDLVVRPTPYGFGSYPGDWAETLRRVKALGYETLIPGHGDIQRDSRYVDLLIEAMGLVAGQMKALVAEGLSEEEAVQRLDFSPVEERFTNGDAFLAKRFEAWFKQPIGVAAYRVEMGINPEPLD